MKKPSQKNATTPFIYDFGIKTIVKRDETTLRLCSRNQGQTINVDIHYNEGLDFYEVKAYELKNYSLECGAVRTRSPFC